jgi:Ca2+-binding EF-hand superfamily protein
MPLSIDTTERAVDDAGPVPEPELEMGVLEHGFFAAADADNDGFVSKSEFTAYCYKRKGRSPDTDDWKTFYAADANGDGRISREEFEKYVDARWISESERGGKPRLMLDTINIEPVADAPVPEPACELGMLEVGFFDAADTDNDGFVSKAEFAAYRLKQCGQAPSPDDWKAFYAADDNGDGRISRSEFETFVSAQWAGSKFQHDTDDRVVIHSLRSATEHNGKAGVVVAFNPENGRYAVRMDDGAALSVRPGNLRSEGDSRTVAADDGIAAPADVMPDEDPEIQRARSELARSARARKQEISAKEAAAAAAQVRGHLRPARRTPRQHLRLQVWARCQKKKKTPC